MHQKNGLWRFKQKDCKVEKILKGSLDSIPSPSLSVKIQIMGGKVGLTCKSKTLLGFVNKLFSWQRPAMFCQKKLKQKNSNVYNSLKVIGSNPVYHLKSSLFTIEPVKKTYQFFVIVQCFTHSNSGYIQPYSHMTCWTKSHGMQNSIPRL